MLHKAEVDPAVLHRGDARLVCWHELLRTVIECRRKLGFSVVGIVHELSRRSEGFNGISPSLLMAREATLDLAIADTST